MYITRLIILLFTLLATVGLSGKELNDRLLNKPYADMRPWHLGFSIGLHTEDTRFIHNGLPTPDGGETWFMEQPSFSPGFCVTALANLRLNDYFSLRATPGMYFGNREITFVNTSATEPTPESRLRQNMKSAYIVAPLDIKYSALRHHNMRPYITAGVMGAWDVAKKRSDYLKFNTADVYLTAGLGCDLYLPYFKLSPELKFCFGLTDLLSRRRPDLEDDPSMMKITNALDGVRGSMVVLSFYFE